MDLVVELHSASEQALSFLASWSTEHPPSTTQFATYCRGADRCDGELLRSAYHDDAREDHGDDYRGGPNGYVAWVLGRVASYLSTSHHLGQVLVEMMSDTTARVESYVMGHHTYRDDDGLLLLERVGARYADRFEERPGSGWRISRRRVVVEWRTEEQATSWHSSVAVSPPHHGMFAIRATSKVLGVFDPDDPDPLVPPGDPDPEPS